MTKLGRLDMHVADDSQLARFHPRRSALLSLLRDKDCLFWWLVCSAKLSQNSQNMGTRQAPGIAGIAANSMDPT